MIVVLADELLCRCRLGWCSRWLLWILALLPLRMVRLLLAWRALAVPLLRRLRKVAFSLVREDTLSAWFVRVGVGVGRACVCRFWGLQVAENTLTFVLWLLGFVVGHDAAWEQGWVRSRQDVNTLFIVELIIFVVVLLAETTLLLSQLNYGMLILILWE